MGESRVLGQLASVPLPRTPIQKCKKEDLGREVEVKVVNPFSIFISLLFLVQGF